MMKLEYEINNTIPSKELGADPILITEQSDRLQKQVDEAIEY
ncbi:hypothetical protein [Parashewanella hymeniacidonis]|nr:hypothetical protein [Parashewanella hymeniacidonis]